jgi:hypothetical protein
VVLFGVLRFVLAMVGVVARVVIKVKIDINCQNNFNQMLTSTGNRGRRGRDRMVFGFTTTALQRGSKRRLHTKDHCMSS